VDKVLGIFMAFILLAAASVVISRRSNTAKVLEVLLTGFQNTIKASTAPATK
jgi:hypothetical protein